MKFTEQEFDAFEKELKVAIKDLCEKYQVKLKNSKITYDLAEFDMKLTFQKNEEGINAEELSFISNCYRYGFAPTDYMRSFEHLGTEYEFIGFATSAKKYNCLIRELDTGLVSRVNHKTLAIMLKRDAERATKSTKKNDLDKIPAISQEEMSVLRIKLEKSKRTEKDWSQIKEIFRNKKLYAYKPTQTNIYIRIGHGFAEIMDKFLLFTSVEACQKHIDELNMMGILSGSVNIFATPFEEMVVLANQTYKDILIDDSMQVKRNYYYASEDQELKVVIKEGGL